MTPLQSALRSRKPGLWALQGAFAFVAAIVAEGLHDGPILDDVGGLVVVGAFFLGAGLGQWEHHRQLRKLAEHDGADPAAHLETQTAAR